jgi:HAD superfamily hydrolase (TIGR01458 family)
MPPIRALLVDIDGTLCQHGRLVEGAAGALAEVERRGVGVRFVTNTTSRPRSALVRELSALGYEVEPERILSAPRAANEYLAARGLARCMMLVRPALLEDFPAVEPVDESPDAVVLGDLGDAFTFRALDAAFRALLDGAPLVTLARNRYFLNREGRLTLDVGPFAVALEYAAGVEATLVGKPAPEFFRLALAGLGAEPAEAAAVGDDLEGDVGGAQAAGMWGVLVRTGKFRQDLLDRSPVRPDAVLDSLAGVARFLAEN